MTDFTKGKTTLPLVALGIPTGDRVHQEFAQCLWGLGRGARKHRQGIVTAQSSMIVSARNHVVQGAQVMDADYLMFLDSDMTFPYSIIDQLLSHDKDIVGATYVRRGPPFDNLGAALVGPNADRGTGLIEMKQLPTGLLLINMRVFTKFVQPIFRFEADELTGLTTGEDTVFSRQARERGFRLWCDIDMSKECAHMYQYPLRTTDAATRSVAEQFKVAANG